MNENATYVAKGTFEFAINGENHIVHEGDALFMSSNQPHSCTCLEEGILIDTFTPVREDFLKK